MTSTKKPQSILVTGGTGFIGRHLVSKLLSERHKVYVLTRVASDSQDIEQVSYIEGNLESVEKFSSILPSIDIVYHLAVTTRPGQSNDKISYDAETNLMGSLKLIECAAKAGVSRFIFTSSGGSVYGVSGARPIAESYPTNPISAHGVSKLSIEKYLEIFRRTYGMTYRIARTSNPYGAGQDPDRGQGFIAYALGRVARKLPLEIWGDGLVVRDYVYIDDVIEALWKLSFDEGKYALYNLGSGEGRSINEIIELIQKMTESDLTVRYTPARPADVPYNCLDVTRIQAEIDWSPSMPINDGLAKTWEWIKAYINEPGKALAN